MKAFLVLVTLVSIGVPAAAQETSPANNVDLLFIAKTILAAVIVFIGISALRSFLRHEKK